MSVKLDNTLSNENIKSSMDNINSATKNIKQITAQVDSTTIPIVNRILCETYSTSKNANKITEGVKNTLKKRMGLSRLLFGKPINNDCY